MTHGSGGSIASEDTMVGDIKTPKRQIEDLNTSNPRGNSNIRTEIDVSAAEDEFHELSRQMSGPAVSRVSTRRSSAHGISTRRSSAHGIDPEKGVDVGVKDVFDLEDHLRGNESDDRDAGIKKKQIGIIWNGLRVTGIGGSAKNIVRTFPDAVIGFFNIFGTIRSILRLNKSGEEVDILRNFRGLLKPGEMCLVLGRPGSGCTTFLKVIANQRSGFSSVDGEVMYGRFSADTFSNQYRGESVYNQEDDVHNPTLTVGQTLEFALDTKTPGKRPAGMSKGEFKDKVVTVLLKMFNISHTRNTVVGNQFVRGVSGGERKRVSIAEMMITKASVCCWDNSTRGLDASTALDYAKCLRIMTNVYQCTTFVSLYQASESIYSQFDKVLVIDSGREVFFGPTKEARAYFEGLGFAPKPRQTTPDYLTGCTDEWERGFAEGRNSTNVPSTPKALEHVFQESSAYARLNVEMEEYREQLRKEESDQIHTDFETAVREEKRKGARKTSVYTVPFYLQVWALMKRQFLLKWGDQFSLVVSWFTSTVIAIVFGTVYLNLPETSAGAFTRGGILFMSLLFNAFQAFGELVTTMIGRGIVNKHKAYTFHRPSALWIAQICVDTIFASTRIMLFCIIVYFMCGLFLSVGAFFIFWFTIVLGYLAMTLLFRTVGVLCPDFDYALKFASIVITLFVLTSGYLIPVQSQDDWISWMFYVNGLGLAFSALMMNEFRHLTLKCTDESLVPHGANYSDLNHQTCTLPGSYPGSDLVRGADYIRMSYSYDTKDLWRNFGLLIVLIVGFLAANSILGEYITFGSGGKTITYFVKEDAERKKLNDALAKRRETRRQNKGSEASDTALKINSEAILTWEDLVYDVPAPSGGQLRLLNNIYGYVKPGTLTALMGASGAGKTTLLDVLASRKSIGIISGDVLVDGVPKGIAFQRGTSYTEQLDVHEPTQTVREALRFSAYLRQPYEVSIEEKNAYVEDVIALLEMENIADAIIGNAETGLAVEERKRVTIGVELAAKPELLLFLDEPTSGLDSQSAFNIIRFLKKLAAAGQAILCTIHQPNASLFENFDRLLLIQRGGHCAYFGETKELLHYFEKHGAYCPPTANIAEWMLDAIGAGQAARIGDRDWADIWRTSEELANVKAEISAIKDQQVAAVAGKSPEQSMYATPLSYQIAQVVKRANVSFWRTPNYGFTRLFNHIVISLFTGVVYINLDDSLSSLQYRVFVIFQVTVLPSLILAQVEPMYGSARLISFREQSSRMYKPVAFTLGMVVAEIPYSLLCTLGFYICIYFPTGMNPAPDRAGYQFLVILICEMFSVSLGQMVAALTPNFYIASLLNPFIIVIFSLFCGVTIPAPNIPEFWRSWLYQLDPHTRLVGGMVVTELHDMPVVCRDIEFSSFNPPSGMTCGDYAGEFMKAASGYIKDLSATDVCQYCTYKVGDEFFEPMGLSYDNRWRDLGIFAAFVVSNTVILFLASRFLNFSRR